MILVFGGTTEGRKAVEVLEVAGKPFYYSTKTGAQSLVLHSGIAVDGAKDSDAMRQFCCNHDIRLLIDAAHPFAVRLHETVAEVAATLHLPVIRYERSYPPHTDDMTWCSDYSDAICQLEDAGINSLLMLTGVQTLGPLKPFWERHNCWCRILDRNASLQLAMDQGFPKSRLVFYEEENTAALIQQLSPQAILTKESGLSGGFMEKVVAAKAAGIKVFVIERPKIHLQVSISSFQIVFGPFGLRRAVEQILPKFFPLKSGLTTGTCATAAVKAAVLALQGEEEEAVWVQLPNGESVLVDIESVGKGEATVVKDFSDDPDVTRGCRITARVESSPVQGCGIRFLQGEGQLVQQNEHAPQQPDFHHVHQQLHQLRKAVPGKNMVVAVRVESQRHLGAEEDDGLHPAGGIRVQKSLMPQDAVGQQKAQLHGQHIQQRKFPEPKRSVRALPMHSSAPFISSAFPGRFLISPGSG